METLQFRIGFGGVMKAEFDAGKVQWTVIVCDDGTVTIYSIGLKPKEAFFDDLTPAQADAKIKEIRAS